MLFMLPSGCIFPGKIRVQFAVQSAFAIVEPKQGQALFSPVAIPDGGTTTSICGSSAMQKKKKLADGEGNKGEEGER